MVQELDDRLAAWTDAGLISAQQAEAIVGHEQRRLDADRSRASRTGPAEAIGYVGAALALGAVALILSDLWAELVVGGRLTLVALLTLALVGSGLVLRGSSAPAMQRLTSVLLAGSIVGVGWFTTVIVSDVLDLDWAPAGVTVGLVTVLSAIPLYVSTRRALLQVTVLGSALIAPVAALELTAISPGPGWYGLVIGSIGAVWFVLAFGGWLTPRTVGEIAGAFVAFVGVQTASMGDARLLALGLGVLVAAGLVGLAVRADRLAHLILGALALFVFSPQLVFEIFGDAIGAPATLLLVGLLLVLLAVGLGRARREVATTAKEGRRR